MGGITEAGVYEGSLTPEMKIPLGYKITVFQAKIYAIYTACKKDGPTGPFISILIVRPLSEP
jgi:hypothetical protein